MKKLFLTFTAVSLMATTALANNSTVEDALKSRDELSHFYDALQKTGVLNELESGTAYAVFAPTNEAFEKMYGNPKYPCFGDAACTKDFAEILRNHFSAGYYDLSQESSVFAINKRQLIIGHPHRGHDSVDGNMVEEISQLMGSVLYEIDGVIVNETELSMFRHAPQEPATATRKNDVPRDEEGFPVMVSPAR